MERQISCEFNIDTACVEVKYADGSMISIDCTRVENEVARNMYEASEPESGNAKMHLPWGSPPYGKY